MREPLTRSILSAGVICTLCLLLAGCPGDDSLNGTYHPTGGGAMALDFKGSKVTVTMAGQSQTYDYKVDGNKITIINPQEGNLELTRNSDGSINSAWGAFTKSK